MPTMDTEISEWLSPAETAKILGLNARQVRRMLKYATLPGVRLRTGPEQNHWLWRIRRSDVEAYLAAVRNAPREDPQP